MTQDKDVLTSWTEWQQVGGAAAGTIRVRVDYAHRLTRAYPGRDLADLSTDDLLAWMASYPRWSANTRRSVRSALTGLYQWMMLTGRCSISPAALLPRIRVPRGRPRPTPEAGYRRALLSAAPRERLAIRLTGQCGLRLGEAARVRTDDVETDLIGYTLRVLGKGSHVRLVPLPDDVAEQLLSLPRGWAFPSTGGGHLTPNHLGKCVSAHLPPGLTTHTLRHRAASTAYHSTHDLRAVQEMLGHASPVTTAGYAAVSDRAVRDAVASAA